MYDVENLISTIGDVIEHGFEDFDTVEELFRLAKQTHEKLLENPNKIYNGQLEGLEDAITRLEDFIYYNRPKVPGPNPRARDESLSRAMSADAQIMREGINARRQARYDEMIAAQGEPVESPMDRLAGGQTRS